MKNSLEGKVIISTHSAKANDEFGDFLRKHGATVFSMPTIAILPQAFEIQRPIADYNWIVFTSPNSVLPFLNQIRPDRKNKIAALGAGTAAALAHSDIPVNFTGNGNSAVEFADELVPLLQRDEKILLVLGELAPETLQQRLKEIAFTDRINVYKTEIPETVNSKILERIRKDDYDLLTISSPSAYTNLCELLNGAIENLRIVSIGQTTTAAIQMRGIEPLATSPTCSFHSLAETCLNHITNEIKTIQQ